MNKILEIIKQRATKRNYSATSISERKIKLILEAGLWGPSVMGVQPWKFVVLSKSSLIKQLYKVITTNSKESSIGSRFIFHNTARAIAKAKVIIGIYNSFSFSTKMKRFGKEYLRFAQLAEIESIAACIQNMLLMAEALHIGTAWLDTPLLFEPQINKIFKEHAGLVALITLGYSRERAVRAPRKPLEKYLKFIR